MELELQAGDGAQGLSTDTPVSWGSAAGEGPGSKAAMVQMMWYGHSL